MTVFVSIVSHNNTDEIIHELRPENLQTDDIRVVVTDNQPDQRLAAFCAQHSLAYLKNATVQGFGHNHNNIYKYCRANLGLNGDDWFVVLNPDVLVQQSALYDLIASMKEQNALLAAPNLYKDRLYQVQETSIRRFPYLWNSIASFLLKSIRATNLDNSQSPHAVDWASGAFLVFKAGLYEHLGGFDESYYLYYEDVDICWRALKLEKISTLYLPSIKAVHAGKRESRKSINRYLWWHIASVFRFSWVRVKTALLGAKVLRRDSL